MTNHTQSKTALALFGAAAAGLPAAAEAVQFTATLNQVLTYSNNGTAGTPANISSSNTIFSYDDVTNLVTQGTGLLNIRLTTSPSTTLYRTSITGLVVGNGGAASASTYVCTEGNFAGTSNASICGNYSFGGNFTNDSTLTYGPGTTVTRTLGGDDVSIGLQQSIAGYNNFATVSFTGGTELILSNATCNPAGAAGSANCTIPGAFNAGLQLRFATVALIPGVAVDDSATVESGIATNINVLANDTSVPDPVTVSITVQPTNGTATITGTNPGAPGQIAITYDSNDGYAGADSLTYRIQGANATDDTAVLTLDVQDTTPDAFSFAAQPGVARSTAITSNQIGIGGLANPTAISVSAGSEYQIGSNGFTSVAGTVNNNDLVTVRHTSAAGFSANTVTTLTIGGVDGTFTSTTLAEDTAPDAFSFAPVTGAALNTAVTSAEVIIQGINAPAPISLTSGAYSIDNGPFLSGPGTIANGQGLRVQQISSGAGNTTTTITASIGGVTGDFAVTTVAGGDTQPDAFTFFSLSEVNQGEVQVSNEVTITGINTAAPLTVTGGEYSIDGAAFTAAAGATINNGQTLRVRHTSAATPATAVTTTVRIGPAAPPPPAPNTVNRSAAFASVTAATGDGGSSSADGLLLSLLSLLGLRRLRKTGVSKR